jgi:peptidoglycan-associated lipoprotein
MERSIPPLAAALLTAVALSGCMTPHIHPGISQAVLDARAHRTTAQAAACDETGLGDISPVFAGFGFRAADLGSTSQQKLDRAARWLSCHPTVQVVITADADKHGTPAEQRSLADQRGKAAWDYLVAQGVSAQRLRILPFGQQDTASPPHMLIQAQGQGW